MREFFRSLQFKIFAAIALVLIGLMLRSALSGGSSTITASVFGTVVSPFQQLSSTVSDFFYGAFSNIASAGQLRAENDTLKKQLSDLRSQLVNYNQMQQENEQYQKMYSISKENPDLKLAPARVISRDPGQWYSAFTINKGSVDGIQPYEPVITPDGLVGETTQVMATTTVVTTILDPTVKVSIVVSETGDLGLAHGDRDLSAKGLLAIDYLPKDSAVAGGNIIVTAGRAGVFPPNLKVGLVQQVKTQNSGITLYAVCKPLADPTTVKDVTVVTNFTGKNVDTSAASSK
ncbi:rod shape-determining protein MreC [Ethanoligenens harbinense]|uniref:Cell shape-determining protein MreC n=1 Tax=Ethanoligenens harbinense (strain DSM 18485 / JCM 12961 / CGMCC 1.5033 / YUAN-3) TaxID=663278 RepID=E6U7E3_ETHHY|nr:rod shape-determining protein MreC [Ethanoligenens harbinense]ADU25878.1 rod shape-determining protein MreC [Ethanoligenens harbinense YUAN-3]